MSIARYIDERFFFLTTVGNNSSNVECSSSPQKPRRGGISIYNYVEASRFVPLLCWARVRGGIVGSTPKLSVRCDPAVVYVVATIAIKVRALFVCRLLPLRTSASMLQYLPVYDRHVCEYNRPYAPSDVFRIDV